MIPCGQPSTIESPNGVSLALASEGGNRKVAHGVTPCQELAHDAVSTHIYSRPRVVVLHFFSTIVPW